MESSGIFDRIYEAKENMGNKLYVGNLPFSANDDSLREMFNRLDKWNRRASLRIGIPAAVKVSVSSKCQATRKRRTRLRNSMAWNLKAALLRSMKLVRSCGVMVVPGVAVPAVAIAASMGVAGTGGRAHRL